MEMFALRQAKRDLFRRFTYGLVHGNLDAPLNFTDVLEVRVEPAPIARAKGLLKKRNLLRDRIENAGVLLSSGTPLLRTCSIAEQAFESHPRIDFRRKRLRGRGPGYGVRVSAAITPVAIAEVADVLDAQL